MGMLMVKFVSIFISYCSIHSNTINTFLMSYLFLLDEIIIWNNKTHCNDEVDGNVDG